MKTSTCFKGSYSLIVSYSRTVSNYFESKSDINSLLITVGLIYLDKKNSSLMIAYFTLFVGEQCSHMMINRTLEYKHHNVLMISSLLIVKVLFKQNSRLFPGFFQDFQPIFWIRLNNKIKTFSLS